MENIAKKVLKVVEDTVVDRVTDTGINTSGCGTPELQEKRKEDNEKIGKIITKLLDKDE